MLLELSAETRFQFQPDIVVNCAAISVPRACETDPVSALSINVPTALGTWLLSFEGRNTLLIHLSTDQGNFLVSLLSIIFLCFNVYLFSIYYLVSNRILRLTSIP